MNLERSTKFTEDLDKLITEASKDCNDLDVEDSRNHLKRAIIRSGEERGLQNRCLITWKKERLGRM